MCSEDPGPVFQRGKKKTKKQTKKKQIQTERQREAAVKILKIKEERKQTENAV